MQVNEYDGVLLKDGREAIVIEKFDDTPSWLMQHRPPKSGGIIDITIEDIEKVTTKARTTK